MTLVDWLILYIVVHLQVKGGIGDVFDDEAHLAESLDDKVALILGGVSDVHPGREGTRTRK